MEKNRLKNSELLSVVTHEIKNSLNPVINLSGILLRSSSGRLTSDENSYLEVIERNGRKILHLVEEYSFLNKLTGKKLEHVYSPVSMREIIDTSVIGMMALSSYAGCELICDIDDESVLPVAEKEILRRIIENICLFLLSSGGDHPAIYFKTALSGSELTITASRRRALFNSDESGSFDKTEIIGKGYSASSVMWLNFASLYSYYLKGDVRFSGDHTGDTVFQFIIPVMHGREGVAEITPKTAGDAEKKYSDREFVMLVIDDDIDNIIPVNAIIENEFKGAGKVYHAESGGAGLDLLEKIQPDIILLDLTLPDISGLSLVKNIKHLFVKKNIPVIAFTALDIAGDKNKMIKSGFDDVIRKPFNIENFAQKIREWLD
jgi:CheY-like chemotaxis protein